MQFRKQSTEEFWKKSGISRTYPSYRNHPLITVQSWIAGKRQDDAAEGLWRIHDTLYDFTEFLDRHPGGSFWLKQTRGTDITELFESHHLSTLPEQMLINYKVREASQPRNYKFTYNANGFYRTLKGRVREHMHNLNLDPRKRSKDIHIVLLASTIALFLASAVADSMIFELLAALALCWLSVSAHNFFHQRDNWQMYTFNMTLMNFCDWRISHAMSHHQYPNSLHDLEMSFFEPFLCWVPSTHFATKLQRYISLLIQPIVYAAMFHSKFIARIIQSIVKDNVMFWHDGIAFILPMLMMIVSSRSPMLVFGQWNYIVAVSSFIFGLIAVNAGHHGPEIYHDGDTIRTDRDWGLYQTDIIVDRGDIKGSHFMVLTHFGDHALHHLFPTIDHGVLPQLYPILHRTLKEFGEKLRDLDFIPQIVDQNKQLLRMIPNEHEPGNKFRNETEANLISNKLES